MPDIPSSTPPSSPAPSGGKESPPMDGLSAATVSPSAPVVPNTPAPVPEQNFLRLRKKVLMTFGVLYGCYVLWCAFLLVTLPMPTGEGKSLVSLGMLTSLVGLAAFVFIGWFGLRRISSSQTSIATRRRSLIIFIAVLTPAVLLSIVTPLLIRREPALPLDVTDPVNAADFVAPLPVTFSVERSVQILRTLGLRPVKYQWDTEGDGKINEETAVPRETAVYERQGSYTVTMRIVLDTGAVRRLTRRLVIPQAVFSVTPIQPVIEKPIKFSVAGLLTDPKLLKQVQWDFGDGTPTETDTKPETAHTYYAVGAYAVIAIVQMQNNTQGTYKRTVNVREPPPLPFPITLTTEPATLVGPVPFGVIFRLQTKEILKDVAWTFGDGKEDRGADLVRESHSYETPGIYSVDVRARSESGSLAQLTTLVRATEVLSLRDLTFEGTPVVSGKISGEVPLQIDLIPKTTTPLAQFSWEVPSDPNIQVAGSHLTGIFRREGSYTVTLMAQGAEGKSMRMPIMIEVKPPSAEPDIQLKPDGGEAPLTVSFDASQSFIPPGETVAGFKWLFGDDGQGTKKAELGAAHVDHTYKLAGQYTITLSVVLTSGKEYTAQHTIIVRKPTISACFTASRLIVEVGKGIAFDSSCSTGEPASLVWDVRSSSAPEVVLAQSADAQYIHVFDSAGEYLVTLTLKDAQGNEDKKTLTVTVSEPTAQPEPQPSGESLSSDSSSSENTPPPITP